MRIDLKACLRAVACAAVIAMCAPAASAADVEVLFDTDNPNATPFPSDLFTEHDFTNLTALRVSLPLPDCAVQVSDCADLAVINTLDGFNQQPRLRIPFSGAIDPASVNSSNVFLVSLGDTTSFFHKPRQTVGIDRIVWDPSTNTLFAESAEYLDEHTQYALIVTDGVRDASGRRVDGREFKRFLAGLGYLKSRDWRTVLYRNELIQALFAARVPFGHVVGASVFTTQSATANMEKIRKQIKRAQPARADFVLGGDGSRTVYPLASLSSILFSRQNVAGPVFAVNPTPLAALGIVPNSVSTIAFGRYSSPNYETAERFIPQTGTRFGTPQVQSTETVYFNLFVPSGAKPASGWPVAIYGHGFGDSKQGSPFVVAASLAARGIAVVSINVVGHGGGNLGSLIVNRPSLPAVTLPAGGRGIDQNGDGAIAGTEGVDAAPPRTVISSRDGLRQTVIDLMQLVRVIETGGVDVDGDGNTDLSADRIYYFGQSFGGIYGSMLLGLEPNIRAGVLNVPGGPIIEIARMGAFRPAVGQGLLLRVPSLANALPFAPPLYGFDENAPLRNDPTVINTVPGAIAIQNFLDHSEWVSQQGNPVAYAPLIRKDPLRGSTPKPVIVQIAKGDQTVPNPSNSNVIRAGDLQDRTTYFRNDLAEAANPANPNNPHAFLTSIASPLTAPMALAAQAQIAVFFQSDGATTIDPDGAGALFETPIPELPEELNYLP